MNSQNFLAELKRRNVYKVAVAYGVVAWLVVQIASTVLPTFHAPEWVLQSLVLLVALGFPVALVLAWAFELTPEGIVRTEEVAPQHSITRRTGRILDFIIIGVLLMVIAFFILERRPSPERTPSETSEKGIAVLPFNNLSEDKANAYFADGIQDEILTRLANVSELKVISRTSTQRYKGKAVELRDIAKELGVANLLEGSVQKAGEAVHVNVQLINGITDSHIWAQSFDGKLTDIFAFEGEIAKTVAQALKAKLTRTEQEALTVTPTINTQAHDSYLRGLALWNRADNSPQATTEAISFYEKAVQLDPSFAIAWAQLSIARSRVYFLGGDRTAASAQSGKEAATRAHELQPELPEAILAIGYYDYWVRRDYDAALSTFKRVLAKRPNNAEAFAAIGYIERRQGKIADALTHLKRAAEMDPRNTNYLGQITATYHVLKQFTEALAISEQVLNIEPVNPAARAQRARLRLSQTGDISGAADEMKGLRLMPENSYIFEIQVRLALIEQRYADAINMLEAAVTNPPPSLGYQLGEYWYLLGWSQQLAGNSFASHEKYLRARLELEKRAEVEPDNADVQMYLAFVGAALGEKEAAIKAAQAAITACPTSSDYLRGPAYEEAFARVRAQLGDKDGAIRELRRLLGVNYYGPDLFVLTPALLRVDPVWNSLRDDQRFQELVSNKSP